MGGLPLHGLAQETGAKRVTRRLFVSIEVYYTLWLTAFT